MPRPTPDSFKPSNEIVERAILSASIVIKGWILTPHGYKNTLISVNHIELANLRMNLLEARSNSFQIWWLQCQKPRQIIGNVLEWLKWGDNLTLFVTKNSPCQAS